MVPEKESGRITDRITKLESEIAMKDTSKPFKFPWGIRSKRKTLAKKNKALIVYLRNNRNVEFKIANIEYGLAMFDEKYYDAAVAGFFNYNGMPVIVQPEWSLKPITDQHYFETLEKKGLADPQQIIIRAMQVAIAQQKKGFGGSWIWLIIGGIAVVFIIMQLLKKPAT